MAAAPPAQQACIEPHQARHRRRDEPLQQPDKGRQHHDQADAVQRQTDGEQHKTARHGRERQRQREDQHREEQERADHRPLVVQGTRLVAVVGLAVERADTQGTAAGPEEAERGDQRHHRRRGRGRHPAQCHALGKGLGGAAHKARQHQTPARHAERPACRGDQQTLEGHQPRHLPRRHARRAQQRQHLHPLLDADCQGVDQHAEGRQYREREQERRLTLEVGERVAGKLLRDRRAVAHYAGAAGRISGQALNRRADFRDVSAAARAAEEQVGARRQRVGLR